MVSTSILALIVAASILSPTAFIVVESSQTQMNQLDTQFNEVMNQTTGFLDHAWSIGQQFQNPDYNYDPSELGNYTSIENPAVGGS